MTEIVNLRQARKQKTREEARRKGDENAAKFGRTRAQKAAEDSAVIRAALHLDRHRRDEGRVDD